MTKYAQANRPLELSAPLPKDELFIERLWACEEINALFTFQLDLFAANETEIPFNKLLGAELTVQLKPGPDRARFFSGVVSRFRQGGRDDTFTTYHAELVPRFWLLTNTTHSRIFQHKTVPQILQEVLREADAVYDLEGSWDPRDYCVQYRETDFNFASRLMEEEGIYYFFEHSADGHRMVVSNKALGHPLIEAPSEVTFEEVQGGNRKEERITSWAKTQTLKSGKYRLWDYSFQLPRNHLEAVRSTLDQVRLGTVDHVLKVPANEQAELYDYPGAYAQRYDGINGSGGETPEELTKLRKDGERTAGLRMEAETAGAIRIEGTSNCERLSPGHGFSLRRHFNADGEYLLRAVTHHTSAGLGYRSGNFEDFEYQNAFECIPAVLPYRPPRESPKPVIQGTQTAVVVGPAGQEVFTDKYGRVKVQFRWDRRGTRDANSSCWIRVGQLAAGKRWGASFWPRIGQEVIVAFEEGDPDCPIIVGSVYNPDQMPPYKGDGLDPKHRNDQNVSGIKTNSTPDGNGFNELRFDDNKGKEQLFLHAERNLEVTTKNDSLARTYRNRHQIIGFEQDGDKGGDQQEMVYQDKHLTVHRNHIEQVGGSMQLLVGGIGQGQGDQDLVIKGAKRESIGKDDHLTVAGDRRQRIGGGDSLSVKGDLQVQVDQKHALEACEEIHLKS